MAAAEEVPRVDTGQRLGRPPPGRLWAQAARAAPRTGLGFRALFSERPSAVIKARQAG